MEPPQNSGVFTAGVVALLVYPYVCGRVSTEIPGIFGDLLCEPTPALRAGLESSSCPNEHETEHPKPDKEKAKKVGSVPQAHSTKDLYEQYDNERHVTSRFEHPNALCVG